MSDEIDFEKLWRDAIEHDKQSLTFAEEQVVYWRNAVREYKAELKRDEQRLARTLAENKENSHES